MSRIFGIMQIAGVALLLGAAGASDAGGVALGVTAVWVLVGTLLVAAGTLAGPMLAAGKTHAKAEGTKADKVIAFPPIDAA